MFSHMFIKPYSIACHQLYLHSFRKVIKLKEEHNFLQKAIASNTAASARMRKEQTEMEGDEALALSKKEVITLNARNLVSARQSFIERTSLLKGLLPTGDHDNS